ncbi:ComF family protein [Pseudomonas sp. HR96]|uniref:ComF family protein n=1 Tax=Pseudomonas sp. HR96 TaxID=1027966 RepID=UPI002A7646CC|nr:ComF family protein [Pseudomonas sp. HR96]WPP00325.1 ComF family protein [Pseudomonas sp. HR96]
MHCQPPDLRLVYNWLFNNQSCLLCGDRAEAALALCAPCTLELPWLRERCRRCALPMAIDGLLCGQCSRRRPAFRRVEVPLLYAYPVDGLVTRFKHQARWPIGRLLGELLGQWLQHRFSEDLVRPDCLMPVPLAPRRLRQRGFNQAALLARWLGAVLAIPCAEGTLLRPRETTAQQDLPARARRHNLRQAFRVAADAAVNGRHIALIDDVLTTGATAQAAARCLLDAGARQVDVYCLARTAKPRRY